MVQTVAVLGAGSWGTALAIQLARCGHRVLLWGRNAEAMARLAAERVNARYLPDTPLPAAVAPTGSLDLAGAAEDLLIAMPSHAFRQTVAALGPGTRRVAWATKGLEEGTGRLLHEVAAEILGPESKLAALSGPTFAREVASGLPTAVTVAANDPAYADRLAATLHSSAFRVYTSKDLVGVGLGGAVKNVIAIAAGMADGLGLGANSRAALITRGLAEIMRLGRKLGARSDTLMGLAGLGDLVLTCTDDQSRNRRFGLGLARGETAAAASARIGQTVEGVYAAAAVRVLSRRHGVEMPICDQVHRVLREGVAPQDAVAALLGRARRAEHD
ncbi:MAG: NAD(P)-dependent glycerol-3-phosphate dehydrogenase [Rhodospirillales bacterium]|nr:NAD(P)-dependent glycerol-3-phosphate dehydrogenase [Rhodospirillales bacterium]